MTTPAGVEFLRTPEERFDVVEGFPYEPHYVEVDGLQMAYIAEGPTDGVPLLLLHGEPTWSYLYRRMIPILLDAGHRIIAPDLIGFGRSDKPTARDSYTYAGHVAWLATFVERLDLSRAVLFGQDWGGLLGLRLVTEKQDRFDRLIIGNTVLPDGSPMSPGFMQWQEASQTMKFMDTGRMLQRATLARELTQGEMDSYAAPFPDEEYMAGARQFPLLVPTGPDDPAVPANRAAWEQLRAWEKPTLTLWAPGDQILGGYQSSFVDNIPGAAGQPHQTFEPGGHFIQDDCGEDVARAMVDWLAS